MGIRGKTRRLFYMCYKNCSCKVCVADEFSGCYLLRCKIIHQGGYLSLLKYIAFIDSLVTELKDSKLCSRIHKVHHLASCCYSKKKKRHTLPRLQWSYTFNAKESAILVYGEIKGEHLNSSKNRNFMLSCFQAMIISIVNCIYEYDECVIAERFKKGKRNFNAATELSFRKKWTYHNY